MRAKKRTPERREKYVRFGRELSKGGVPKKNGKGKLPKPKKISGGLLKKAASSRKRKILFFPQRGRTTCFKKARNAQGKGIHLREEKGARHRGLSPREKNTGRLCTLSRNNAKISHSEHPTCGHEPREGVKSRGEPKKKKEKTDLSTAIDMLGVGKSATAFPGQKS